MNPRRIALIEDSKEDRDLYKFYLQRSMGNVDILEFEYGKEALNEIPQTEVECILLDYNLPDMTAFELLEAFQDQKGSPVGHTLSPEEEAPLQVPIIILTGRGSEDIVVDAFKMGVCDYIIKSKITKELLLSSVKSAMNQYESQKIIQSQTREIVYQANHDALTHLFNRKYLEEYCEQLVAKSKRHQQEFAVLYLDLDKFKFVNDTFGHHVGDQLLIDFSKRLANLLRKEDVICRIGGDEFIVIMEYIKHPNEVAKIAKKIVNSVSEVFHIEEREIYIGVSIGIYYYNGTEAISFDSIIQHADKALYAVKQSGKNNFQFFSNELEDAYNRKIYIENNLKSVTKNKCFQLLFQPQYDLQTSQMIGLETLLRWEDPFLGMIQPNEFIPVAEESGGIIEVGHWVLAQIAKRVKHREIPAHLKIAVNISSMELQDPNFIPTLKALFGFNLGSLHQVEFELAEKEIVNASKQMLNHLDELQKLGVSFAIDNFGIGASSLCDLSCLKYETLKIDPSIIKGISQNEKHQEMINFLNNIGYSLGKRIVCHGIENKDDELTLKSLGCVFGQGFYYQKPTYLEKIIN